MDRYIKCIRETATDITPGRVYRLIEQDNDTDGTYVYFDDDLHCRRCRPFIQGSRIMYQYVDLESFVIPTEETSCL
jgi:hypothetical protein